MTDFTFDPSQTNEPTHTNTNTNNNNTNNSKSKSKGGGGFQSLNLSPQIYHGIQKLGYRTPTPVQRKALPIILTGVDAVVMARTGSGKTVAFLIPVLEKLIACRGNINGGSGGFGGSGMNGGSGTSGGSGGSGGSGDHPSNRSAAAIILSPTRELSLQTLKVLRTLGHHLTLPPPTSYGFRFVGIHGGESMEKQFHLLSTHPDVIVATPGRLAHHLAEIPDFHLRNCEMVVMDEADRLFEMGFAQQLRTICSSSTRNGMHGGGSGMPETRQTLLFSATMPKALVEFTQSSSMGGMMNNGDPVMIRLDNEVQVSEELRIGFVCCRTEEKDAVLLHLVRDVLPLMKGTSTSMEEVREDGGGEELELATANHSGDKKKKLSKKQLMRQQKKLMEKQHSQNAGKHSQRGLILIFAATRHHVEYLTLLLRASHLSATHIYGNMDQSARNSNLHSFTSGKTPILVVTDVAARGIDVPLIDHVIHYAFPPSAKLFVHRSGRAARAGRIGYCWGLVDGEEMPYMVDLHLFLGRRMSTGYEVEGRDGDSEDVNDVGDVGEDKKGVVGSDREEDMDDEKVYTLDEMTPDMVHYGTVPETILVEEVENVRRIVDSELVGSHDADVLRSLKKVCDNAMKQYRRSRPEASREGVRRAKALLEGEKDSGSGRRILNSRGGIPTHPLLRKIEMDKLESSVLQRKTTSSDGNEDPNPSAEDVKRKLADLKKRQEFLRAMANFRPKETVFEAFATGGGKDVIFSSQVDKNKKNDGRNGSAAALIAMKSMRRQMKMARDKGSALVVAGSKTAQMLNGEMAEEEEREGAEMVDDADAGDDESVEENAVEAEKNKEMKSSVTAVESISSNNAEGKRRLSKAERKRMKKDPNFKPITDADSNNLGSSHLAGVSVTSNTSKKAKRKRGSDFRDNLHFMENDSTPDTAAAARSRQIEAAMQPSAAINSKSSTSLAYRMEENMLDIVGDENADLVKRQRMMRWDKSKRKYVQTTVGDELSGDSKSKKMRLESGQLVKSDKLKLGELYEKWQKKTNRSIGRVGIFDDVTDEVGGEGTGEVASKKGQKGGGKQGNGKNQDGKKSAVAIRKEREKKENLKIKNMKKSDRRQLEQKKRAEKEAAESSRKKGFQGKKGSSGRWKGHQKKGGKR